MAKTDLSVEMKKYSVSIEYCVPCDYSEQVFSAVQELIYNYQHIIDTLVIITGSHGVFDIKVDDKVLFSKKEYKRFPKSGEVVELFKKQVGTNVPTYPR
ncbi:MAG: SelT/SelW/SelH family protein [Chloroflexi bacterium]|nr:MAG: SelT/SelW/SelH family protein [Chloroflexota bacterium]